MTGALFRPDGATIHFEVAWGQTAEVLDADLTWTDESDRLVSWQCMLSSRPSEFEVHQAGTATFVVDNSDRRYDPQNTSGALYSSLDGKVGHPVRMYINPPGSGSWVDIWRGFIARIDQGREVQFADRYIGAVFQCFDALGWLAGVTLPDSAWSAEVLRGVRFEDDGSAVPAPPRRWWRLGESDGTVMRDSTPVGTPLNGTYVGTTAPTYNYRRGICNASPDGAIQFDGTDMHATIPSDTLTPPFTWHVVISPQTLDRRNPIRSLTGSGSASCVWEITAANEVKITYNDGADQRSNTSAAQTFDPAQVYSLTAVVLPNAAPVLWLDTVNISGAGSGSGTLGAITGTGYIARDGTDYLAAVLDEVLEYDFDLSALPGYTGGSYRPDDLFDVRRDAWDQDLFHQRCKKILDAAEWPVDLRYVTTAGTWEMDPAEFAGRNALQYLQEIARSEDGLIHADQFGYVNCIDRRERFTWSGSTISRRTFSDDPAASSVVRYKVITPDGYDLGAIRNRITAARKYGSELVAQDTTIKAGQAEHLGTLMLRDEANIQSLLDRRLAMRKTPAQAIRRLVWSPRADQYAALDDTISHRITVVQTFGGVGSSVTQDSWIEGITHEGTVRTSEGGPRWDVTYTLSPVAADPD